MPTPIRILFEDAYVFVFAKPSGLLTIPSPVEEKKTLTENVNRQLSDQLTCRLHPCHRLDKETSGAILFAKGKKSQKHMMASFAKGEVAKTYIAFARGSVRPLKGVIQQLVSYHQHGRYVKKVKPKMAVTRYKVLWAGKDFSVLEVKPETGRMHQIRIHFSQKGHPLLGERMYAFGKDFNVKFRRVALHSYALEWQGKGNDISHRAIAPLAKDMSDFLKKYSIKLKGVYVDHG